MPTYFADTSFWIALSNRRDQYHAQAVKWTEHIRRVRSVILTTEAVLWEWMNALADVATRQTAAQGYRRLHRDPSVEVMPFLSDLDEAALRVYESRHDKAWSLTDCLSFTVMTQRKLTQALTTDHHFQQAGFEPMLLTEPPKP